MLVKDAINVLQQVDQKLSSDLPETGDIVYIIRTPEEEIYLHEIDGKWFNNENDEELINMPKGEYSFFIEKAFCYDDVNIYLNDYMDQVPETGFWPLFSNMLNRDDKLGFVSHGASLQGNNDGTISIVELAEWDSAEDQILPTTYERELGILNEKDFLNPEKVKEFVDSIPKTEELNRPYMTLK